MSFTSSHQHSRTDRNAPFVAGLIVTALVAVLVLVVAHELVAVVGQVAGALGGVA